MEKRLHAYFEGRVQGVGFRFTAVEIARGIGIGGWVKNLHDGRVEVTAEADEKKLQEFLSEINRHFSRYIQNVQADWSEASEGFNDFGVKF